MHKLVSGFLSDSEMLGKSRNHNGWPNATTPHCYPTPSCSSVCSARSGIPSEKKGIIPSPLVYFFFFALTNQPVHLSLFLFICLVLHALCSSLLPQLKPSVSWDAYPAGLIFNTTWGWAVVCHIQYHLLASFMKPKHETTSIYQSACKVLCGYWTCQLKRSIKDLLLVIMASLKWVYSTYFFSLCVSDYDFAITNIVLKHWYSMISDFSYVYCGPYMIRDEYGLM